MHMKNNNKIYTLILSDNLAKAIEKLLIIRGVRFSVVYNDSDGTFTFDDDNELNKFIECKKELCK